MDCHLSLKKISAVSKV